MPKNVLAETSICRESAGGGAGGRRAPTTLSLGAERIIPTRPGLCIISADIGVGKTSILCGIAAALTISGQHVLYVIGEGSREDIAGQLQAAGADASRIVLIDTVVEYADVQLLNMLAHRAIAPHLPRVDCLIVDPLATFESDGIRRFRIRQRLAPFHRLAQRKQRPITTYFALHPNKSRRNLRQALDLVPGGWAGSVETVWQIEPSDRLGHGIVELTRARHHPKP